MKLPTWLRLKDIEEQNSPQIPQTIADEPPMPPVPHEHTWQQRAISYAPPRHDLNQMNALSEDVITTLVMGVTTYLDQCITCDEQRKELVLGSPDPQLDDLMTKAVIYGPQYVARAGTTYVIQRYVPPAQPVGLPIR